MDISLGVYQCYCSNPGYVLMNDRECVGALYLCVHYICTCVCVCIYICVCYSIDFSTPSRSLSLHFTQNVLEGCLVITVQRSAHVDQVETAAIMLLGTANAMPATQELCAGPVSYSIISPSPPVGVVCMLVWPIVEGA